jgi:hypothetical protein
MTTKQIAEIAGVSERTVRRIAENEVGYVFAKGQKAIFSEKESIEIMRLIRKKGFIQPRQNAEVARHNADDRLLRLEKMVENLVTIVTQSVVNNQKQIEFKQDYFTIKGYAIRNKMQLAFSEALKLGRECGKISRERDIEIRKADDEQFGQVNSYHIDVLQEVFSL